MPMKAVWKPSQIAYHAFYTKQTDGSSVIVNTEFMNNVLNLSSFEEEQIYEISEEWLTLRAADINFVLDIILAETAQA